MNIADEDRLRKWLDGSVRDGRVRKSAERDVGKCWTLFGGGYGANPHPSDEAEARRALDYFPLLLERVRELERIHGTK